jgi:putative flippase GtrA
VQEQLAQFCDDLFASDIVATENAPFECIPSEFRNWVNAGNYQQYDENVTWPVDRDDFNEVFNRWSRSGREYGGISQTPNFQIDEDGTVLWFASQVYGRFDNELPYTQLGDHFRDWELAMQASNAASPVGSSMGFQACEEWVRMRVEEEFVRGMYWAVGITMCVAVISTAIFLRDFVMCCSIAVAMVTLLTCIMATLAMMQVDISVIEALALSIILGLSIDYAMHLAHAYLDSKSTTRVKKVRDALLERGGSVLSGAITTMGACFILFFGKLQIFSAFARIFLITILYSVYWALVVLMLMLLFWGPQGAAGTNMRMEITEEPRGAKKARTVEMTTTKRSPVKQDEIALELKDDFHNIVNMFDDSDGSTYLGIQTGDNTPRRSV